MNSKRKGSGAERELVKILTDAGIQAVRNDQRWSGGHENPDISAEHAGISFHIEVKRQERLRLNEAIDQAIRDANGKAFPVVVHRSNRQPWLVTFRLDDFLKGLNTDFGKSLERN